MDECSIVVIGDEYMSMGFRLSGVEETYVMDGENAEKKLAELIDREDVGIIIISERMLSGVNRKLKRRIEVTPKPVVVGIPDRFGPIEYEETVGMLIKRAIGIDITESVRDG